MELVWNPIGVPGTVAMAFALAMAAFIYFSEPTRPVNRRLALVLFFEGLVQARTGPLYFMGDPADVAGLEAVHVTSYLLLPVLYLHFLATLETPLARPFRTRAGAFALVAIALAAQALWLLRKDRFFPEVRSAPHAEWEAWSGPWLDAAYLLGALVYFYALAAAISAYRRAPVTAAARGRAKSFAIAFGTRDVLFGLLLLPYPLLTATDRLQDVVLLYVLGGPLITLLFVALLVYGILRSQLFDLELKVKWTMKQSTVAGAFVAVFFIVSETAQTVFSTELGPYLGIGATALLVFALAPLQKVAERVADAAMPGVEASPEYLAYKKLEVYRSALESVLVDANVTEKERLMLQRLRARLGLKAEDAAALEAEVRAQVASRPAPPTTGAASP